MKSRALIVTFFLASGMTWAGDELPARFKFDRYQEMSDRLSFAMGKPSERITPHFAQNLYVASVEWVENGASIVTIRSTDDASFELRITQTRPKEP